MPSNFAVQQTARLLVNRQLAAWRAEGKPVRKLSVVERNQLAQMIINDANKKIEEQVVVMAADGPPQTEAN